MDKNIRTLLVRNERIEVNEDVYRAYYKEREHEKYLDKKKRDNEYSYEGMKEKGIIFEFNEGLIEMSPEEKLLKDKMCIRDSIYSYRSAFGIICVR